MIATWRQIVWVGDGVGVGRGGVWVWTQLRDGRDARDERADVRDAFPMASYE